MGIVEVALGIALVLAAARSLFQYAKVRRNPALSAQYRGSLLVLGLSALVWGLLALIGQGIGGLSATTSIFRFVVGLILIVSVISFNLARLKRASPKESLRG
jgi:hypothetical protein